MYLHSVGKRLVKGILIKLFIKTLSNNGGTFNNSDTIDYGVAFGLLMDKGPTEKFTVFRLKQNASHLN